jgi:hypothetical protein
MKTLRRRSVNWRDIWRSFCEGLSLCICLPILFICGSMAVLNVKSDKAKGSPNVPYKVEPHE